MLFNSGIFFGFFAAFFTLYWLLRHFLADRAVASQNGLILAGSYLFYGWWDERFLLLIALSTACDYVCGLGVAGPRYPKRAIVKALTFSSLRQLTGAGTNRFNQLALSGRSPWGWRFVSRDYSGH